MNAREAVCVLYQPGDVWRDDLWAYARERWRRYGFEPVTAATDGYPSAWRNVAARAAGDWDAAIFADADIVLGSEEQARAALELAAGGGYVCCYTTLHYLDEAATGRLLAGGGLGDAEGVDSLAGIWEGAFAVSRRVWDDLGGMDERFGVNVGQSAAFISAAATLAGLDRVEGDAFHLWHPLVEGRSRDEQLWPRYRAAEGDVQAMRALLEDGRHSRGGVRCAA